jgi:hypothetical protein
MENAMFISAVDPGPASVVDTGPKTFEGLIVRREKLKNFSNGSSYPTFLLAIQVIEGSGIEKGMVLVRRFYSGSMITTVFDELFLAREGHKLTVPYKTKNGNIEIDLNNIKFNTQQLARDHHEKQNCKKKTPAVE